MKTFKVPFDNGKSIVITVYRKYHLWCQNVNKRKVTGKEDFDIE